MARQRDYKAEYARRIERGQQLGLSRSQARGHARPDEAKARDVIGLIKQIQPERVRPKRSVAAKPAQPQPTRKQPRPLKEKHGKRVRVPVSQGKHNKAGQETYKQTDARQYDGKTESRLGNIIETVARETPNAHILVKVIDAQGNEYLIGRHGGINAATLAESLSEMTLDEYIEAVYGRWGHAFAGYGAIARWELTVI